MLNYSKVLPIITRNNLPATIETAIHTSVIFHFISIASGTTRYHKIDDIIICGSSNDDGFGFGIMLLIGGLLVFYNSLKNLKKKRLFENIPTSKMRSIAMGLVELKGKIEMTENLLKDPFDHKDCVYWYVHIEEHVKRGKNRRWVTRHKASDCVPFLFSDDTGSVLVQSNNANMSNVKRDSEYESAFLFSEKLPLKVRKYCNKNNVKYTGWFGGKRKMRCRTTYLEPNDQLYIMGNARPLTEKEFGYGRGATAVIDYKKDSHFLISDKSEKDLIDEHGGQSWLVPLGIILSGSGLGIILSVLGYF